MEALRLVGLDEGGVSALGIEYLTRSGCDLALGRGRDALRHLWSEPKRCWIRGKTPHHRASLRYLRWPGHKPVHGRPNPRGGRIRCCPGPEELSTLTVGASWQNGLMRFFPDEICCKSAVR